MHAGLRITGTPALQPPRPPQPFTVEDLYLHRQINSLHCVAELDRAVCSVSSIDREGDAARTHLWQFRLDGSGGAALAYGDGSDSSPRGDTQVHVAAADADTAEQVGNFASGIDRVEDYLGAAGMAADQEDG